MTILLFFHLLLDAAGAQPVGSHLSKPLDVGQAVVQGAAGCITASTVLHLCPGRAPAGLRRFSSPVADFGPRVSVITSVLLGSLLVWA